MKINTLLVGLIVLVLAGCNNTVQGFGKDMQQNGQEVEKSASK